MLPTKTKSGLNFYNLKKSEAGFTPTPTRRLTVGVSLPKHQRIWCKGLQSKRGFTLIELLVVISIVGLLASVMMVSVSLSRQKARDVVVKQDIKTLEAGFRLYSADKAGYPPTGYEIDPSNPSYNFVETCNDGTSCNSLPSFSSLAANGYMSQIPDPPKGGSGFGWTYVHRLSGSVNPGIKKNANCLWIGLNCGFTPPNTQITCILANGDMPENATAKAVLLFNLEGGVSPDYNASFLGGNALCLY